MDSKELNRIAKTFVDAIMVKELTRAEVIMLLALIEARTHDRLEEYEGIPETAGPPVPSAPRSPEIIPEPPRKVHYDPMYDPEPPFPIEPPPPRPSEDRVIAHKNQICTCANCNRIVYVINRDIADNCKVSDFIESFTPSENTPALSKKAEIQNVDGNISIDCPLCRGSKSLYLIGKKPSQHE